jgi:hypothetical protein
MSNLTTGPTLRPTFKPVVIIPAPTSLVEPDYVDTLLENLTRPQIIVLSVFGCITLICMMVALVFLLWYCCCGPEKDDDVDRRRPENDNEDEDDSEGGKVVEPRRPSGYRERPRKKGRRLGWFSNYSSAVRADQRRYEQQLKQEEWDRRYGTRDAFEIANGERGERHATRADLDRMAREYEGGGRRPYRSPRDDDDDGGGGDEEEYSRRQHLEVSMA